MEGQITGNDIMVALEALNIGMELLNKRMEQVVNRLGGSTEFVAPAVAQAQAQQANTQINGVSISQGLGNAQSG